jgi:ADP-ribose/FAD diphosphatase
MKFCSQCGQPLVERIPPGDDRKRKVCSACGHVHYQNPQVIVGCVVERDGQILLCRRAIEPGRGRWTLPAGFLELGEGLLEGARRETLEEAGADVEILAPHSYLDLPHIGQTYAMFRARLRAPLGNPGEESLEVAFFDAPAIPWQELAFPAVHFALRLLLDDREARAAHLHTAQLRWRGEGSRYDARHYALVDHLRVGLS